jgi:hypothetical protein
MDIESQAKEIEKVKNTKINKEDTNAAVDNN